MPRVSVAIPLYNKAPYIEAALRSVQAQSFQDLEIIVVDDGSTDGGAELVDGFDDSLIVLIRQANAGAGAARNTAIEAARGQWVAFLDADDLWQPHKLDRQLQLLEAHPDLVWANGAYARTMLEGQVRSSAPVPPGLAGADGVIEDALAVLAAGGSIFSTTTTTVCRDALLELGGFDPALRVAEDRDLWVRLAVRHPRLAYVQSPIAVKRRVAGSLIVVSRAVGLSDAPACARRWTTIAGALPPERSKLLRAVAQRALEDATRLHFAAGRFESAREILALLPALDLGTPSWRLRMAAHIPGQFLSFLLGVRRKLWQWALRVDRKSAPSAIFPGAS